MTQQQYAEGKRDAKTDIMHYGLQYAHKCADEMIRYKWHLLPNNAYYKGYIDYVTYVEGR